MLPELLVIAMHADRNIYSTDALVEIDSKPMTGQAQVQAILTKHIITIAQVCGIVTCCWGYFSSSRSTYVNINLNFILD